MACSLIAVWKSSLKGAGPNFNWPAEALNALGSTRVDVMPLFWGISEDKSPVDSSHEFGVTVVELAVVTVDPQ